MPVVHKLLCQQLSCGSVCLGQIVGISNHIGSVNLFPFSPLTSEDFHWISSTAQASRWCVRRCIWSTEPSAAVSELPTVCTALRSLHIMHWQLQWPRQLNSCWNEAVSGSIIFLVKETKKMSHSGQLEKLDFVICVKSYVTFDFPGFCWGQKDRGGRVKCKP